MVALSWGYTVFNCFLRFCKGVIKWIRCDIILPKTKGKNMSLAFQEGAHTGEWGCSPISISGNLRFSEMVTKH